MVSPATISWLGYGWETTYATVSGTVNKPFGHGVRVTNLTRRNNIERVFSTGTRNAQKLAVKKYEGALTTEFVLANPWFFRAVLGAAPTDGGATPFTHTFAESDSVDSFTISNNVGMAADSLFDLLGCKVGTCAITAAVNELVRVRLDSAFANEAVSTSTTSKLVDSYDLYTFAQGSLEIPDGSTLAMVQNAEITIANTPEMIMGLGSRFGQEQVVKNREYSASVTMALQAQSDLLDLFYGASTGPQDTVTEIADMELTFTNGLTSSNERSIVLTFTGVQIDEDSLPQDPTAVIMEDVALQMRSLSVVASDNTQTAL